MGDPILLMSSDRIKRSISRVAYQIAEDNRDEAAILIVGIKQRGSVVAKIIKEQLVSLSKNDVALLFIHETQNSDLQFEQKKIEQLTGNYDCIILVDDVIFSGKTMLAAIQETLAAFNPKVLRTAVLVDRGHRMRPVEATFCGMELPTKLDEHVEVKIEEDALTRVVLSKSGK